MKDGTDSTAVGRAPALDEDREEFTTRKLIRPSLARAEELRNHHQATERPERSERRERMEHGGPSKKVVPPEQTHAENFYYQKQMQSKTPMVIVLQNGEELHGVIEWYDKACIKLNRNGQPNVLVYKPSIKYMFKEAEGR